MRSPFAILCSLTVAASFALIFLLTPMVTKTAPSLPGGAPLFYQIAVLAGAFYAHFLGLLPLRVQGVLHAALGVAALLTLPLAGGVVAMAALAANVALVPRWFSLARPKQTPWRVFALGLTGRPAGAARRTASSPVRASVVFCLWTCHRRSFCHRLEGERLGEKLGLARRRRPKNAPHRRTRLALDFAGRHPLGPDAIARQRLGR